MIRRLCVAQGSWQVLTLTAGLRAADEGRRCARIARHLVLFDPEGLPELRRMMNALAGGVGEWSEIRWADEVAAIRPGEVPWPPPVDVWMAQVRRLTGGFPVDEVWLPHLDGFTMRLFVEAHPKARVIIYEDGYLSQLEVNRMSWAQMLRMAKVVPRLAMRGKLGRYLRSLRLYDARLSPYYVRRIHALYLTLTPPLPLPAPYPGKRIRDVPAVCLREVLHQGSRTSAVREELEKLPSNSGHHVLYLPYSYHRTGIISFEDECALNGRVVNLLLDRGYAVWIKDHPREKAPWYPILQKLITSDRLAPLVISHALPVEFAAPAIKFEACVSATSSAMFYLRELYSIPAYTFAGFYLGQGCGHDPFYGFSTACAFLPDVESIPDARERFLEHGAATTEQIGNSMEQTSGT